VIPAQECLEHDFLLISSTVKRIEKSDLELEWRIFDAPLQ